MGEEVKRYLRMKVGVFSDSHGEIKNLEKAADVAVSIGVDLLIHLGDDYDDAAVLNKYGLRVLKVPGIYSDYYLSPDIPNRVIEIICGKRVLLSHTSSSSQNDLKEDLKPEKLIAGGEIDFLFYGHTHIPFAGERNGIIALNPGHLKEKDKRGYPPSFAVADFTEKAAVIYNLENGKVITECRWK